MGAGASDFPLVVVEEEVVVSAEEDSVGEVGASGVSYPVGDVVAFAPGGGPVAAGPHASAVAGGQGDALSCGVEAVFTSDVQW